MPCLPLRPLALLLTLVAAVPAPAQVVPPAPYDLMERLYRPLTVEGDELGWGMKVASIASGGERKFSTSTREIFYDWMKVACADWAADAGGYVASHGDVHFGNVGVYAADLATGRLAVGLKDFDETTAMPVGTDLLMAMVELRLAAAEGKLGLTPELAASAARELLAAYRAASDTGRTATDLLGDHPSLAGLLDPGRKTLKDEWDGLVSAGRIKAAHRTKKGVLRDVYRPALKENDPAARYERPQIGGALMRAAASSPALEALTIYETAEEWTAAVEDAAIRTRAGSGGSQGMVKMMVTVRSAVKLPGGVTDAVFYFKEQASASAAQRAGYVPAGDLPGGRRVQGGTLVLTLPQAAAVGWAELGGRSFEVSIRNPWDDEPDVEITDEAGLLWGARYLGTVLGAAHTAAAGGVDAARPIRTRVNEALEKQLLERSAAFVAYNAAMHRAFLDDGRTGVIRTRAMAAFEAAGR